METEKKSRSGIIISILVILIAIIAVLLVYTSKTIADLQRQVSSLQQDNEVSVEDTAATPSPTPEAKAMLDYESFLSATAYFWRSKGKSEKSAVIMLIQGGALELSLNDEAITKIEYTTECPSGYAKSEYDNMSETLRKYKEGHTDLKKDLRDEKIQKTHALMKSVINTIVAADLLSDQQGAQMLHELIEAYGNEENMLSNYGDIQIDMMIMGDEAYISILL